MDNAGQDAVNERLKKVIFWLISQGIVSNQKHMAEILGYGESSLSQIVIGKKPLSHKFAQKVCSLSPKINFNYLMGKEDAMFIETGKEEINSETIKKYLEEREDFTNALQKTVQNLSETVKNLSSTVAAQSETIASQQRQIADLSYAKKLQSVPGTAPSVSTTGVQEILK